MKIERPKSRQYMPDNAKKVFQGVLFEAYQWEVDGYDGTKKIFEKLKRPDTVLVVAIDENGEVLMSKQEQPGKEPFVGLFGGRIDEGEDPLEAAKRELKEESGYEAKDWLLLDAYQPVSKIDWAIYVFVAKGSTKVSEQNLDGAEKIDLIKMGLDEFVEFASTNKFGDLEIRLKIMEAKQDPEKMQELRKLLTV